MNTVAPLKIIFAGTPDFAAIALQSLLDAGHHIAAVYCQPDRPSGRGKKLQASPVKQLAIQHHIPVEQPVNFKEPLALERLQAYQSDLMIVVAYGLLLPAAVLNTPRYGCVNIHGSLLPRWRGAAPIQRAIEAGDEESGVTIMQMDEGLDTGNMLLKLPCTITPNETGASLHDKLAALGGQAINRFLQNFDPADRGEVQQAEQANYAHKLNKQEAAINWQETAAQIERRIRAFNAWPVCFTQVGDKRLRVWQAELTGQTTQQPAGTVCGLHPQGIDVACGDNQQLRLTQVQPDGSKAMDAAAFLNARRDWFTHNPVLG